LFENAPKFSAAAVHVLLVQSQGWRRYWRADKGRTGEETCSYEIEIIVNVFLHIQNKLYNGKFMVLFQSTGPLRNGLKVFQTHMVIIEWRRRFSLISTAWLARDILHAHQPPRESCIRSELTKTRVEKNGRGKRMDAGRKEQPQRANDRHRAIPRDNVALRGGMRLSTKLLTGKIDGALHVIAGHSVCRRGSSHALHLNGVIILRAIHFPPFSSPPTVAFPKKSKVSN
jgi:hypothetical protein